MADLLGELRKPADAIVDPPVQTRLQELPFQDLTWPNFERLCLRLVTAESDVESARPYGGPGQRQEGVDFIARPKGASGKVTWVYQCKRWQRVTAADVAGWVNEFVASWRGCLPTRFTLCVSQALTTPETANAIAAQERPLAERGVEFGVWDSGNLNQRLKQCPELVDDFFGRAWVEAFNGSEAASALSARLTGADAVQLRHRLLALYERLFGQHDPGIAPSSARALPLRSRYVWPDVLVEREVATSAAEGTAALTARARDASGDLLAAREKREVAAWPSRSQAVRIPVAQWLARQHRAVVLGDLGTGKSSLLRSVALEILSVDAKAPELSGQWNEFVPIWVPFAGWTKAVLEAQSGVSLVDYVTTWLHRHSADDVAGLVSRLVDDGRLLLLVDGLDERSSDEAAVIALDLLEAFLANHDVPVIMTSRPAGYETVARAGSEWAHARLAPLSEEQQRRFTRFWFRWLMGGEDANAEALSDGEADSLLAEVASRPELSALAEVPLTLRMLVELRRHNVTIPQRRFQVYSRLVDCLLEEQPAQRRRAAGQISEGDLDLTDRRNLLAYLALELQRMGGAGAMPEQQCVDFLAARLSDPSDVWAYDRAAARQLARALIEDAVREAGVLSNQPPDGIAFSHLGLQHWLAAVGLSLRRAEEQSQYITQHYLEPQWREVTLAFLEIRCSTDDGRQFAIDLLRNLRTRTASAFGRCQLDMLLADAVFAHLGLPAWYVRIEAQRLLDLVRESPFPDHAASIALTAVPALHTGAVSEVVERSASRWFPAWSEFSRDSVLERLGKWAVAPDLRETLFAALYDEDPRCRAVAGRSIAHVCGGDDVVGERLLWVARHSVAPGPREGALLALAFGWPDGSQLSDLLARSMVDGDPGVRLSAVEARIHLSLHTDEDRQVLWSAVAENTPLAYRRRDEVAPALLLGWPSSGDLRSECLNLFRYAGGLLHGDRLEQAVFVLLTGWPGDDEIAACFADLLSSSKDDPFGMLHLPGWTGVWDLLAQSFRGHAALAPAILGYLRRDPGWYFRPGGRAVLACGTDEAKEFALERFPTNQGIITDANLAADLLTGWPGDDAVLDRVKQWVEEDPSHAESLARFFRLIYPEGQRRRGLLLSLLRADHRREPHTVLRALLDEEVQWDPDELIEPALQGLDKVWFLAAQTVQGIIVEAFPSHPRAKEVARALLQEPTAFFPTVLARAYEHDDEFRPIILRAATSAPTFIRRLLAEQLSRRSTSAESALPLLSTLRSEDDALARSSAAVGLVLQTAATGKSTDSVIEFLRTEATCLGPEMDRRRPSGVAGLLQGGRTADLLQHVSQSRVGNPFEAVFNLLHPNLPALRLLASQWSSVKADLPPGASATLGIHEDGFWEVMSPWVEEFPDLRSDFETYAVDACQRPLAGATLTAIANVMPRSEVLRTACLSTLKIVEENRFWQSWGVAARLFGGHFGGQDAALRQLREMDASGRNWVVTVALSWGWPDSEAYQGRVAAVNGQSIPWLLYLQLARLRKEPSRLVDGVAEYIAQCSRGAIYRDPEIVHVIELGIRESDAVKEGISGWLSGQADLAVTATGLLRAAEAVTPPLRDQLARILERETVESVPPLVGYDLVAGIRRALAEAVYAALAGTR